MTSDDHTKKIFDCTEGLSWEQRLDFLLKAVNDVSKSLNEAAQSSKILHRAIDSHNDLLTQIFQYVAFNLSDDEGLFTPVPCDDGPDKGKHGKNNPPHEVPK